MSETFLAWAIRRAGLDVQMFSAKLGIFHATVVKWERDGVPRARHREVADVLRLPAVYFLDGRTAPLTRAQSLQAAVRAFAGSGSEDDRRVLEAVQAETQFGDLESLTELMTLLRDELGYLRTLVDSVMSVPGGTHGHLAEGIRSVRAASALMEGDE